VAAPLKHAMSLEAIAEAEGISVAAANMARALRKLRSQGLIFTCRELAEELEPNRRGCTE